MILSNNNINSSRHVLPNEHTISMYLTIILWRSSRFLSRDVVDEGEVESLIRHKEIVVATDQNLSRTTLFSFLCSKVTTFGCLWLYEQLFLFEATFFLRSAMVWQL